MTFARRLYTVRQREGITARALSIRAGLADTAVSRYEMSKSEPLISYALRIAMATGYDIDDLADPAVDLPAAPRRPPQDMDRTVEAKQVGETCWASSLSLIIHRADMSKAALARDIGIGRGRVFAWLREECEPRLGTAVTTANVLDVTVHEMATG